MIKVDGTTYVVQKEIVDGLQELAGVSFAEIERSMAKVQNCPGSDPPLMYVISKLVKDDKVRAILEFGSGGTTSLFSHLADKYGLEYVSLENQLKWKLNTQEAARISGTDSIGLFYREEFFDTDVGFGAETNSALDTFSQPVDLVFIDSVPGQTRQDALKTVLRMQKKNELFHRDTIIMVDDCQESQAEKEVRDIAHVGEVFMSHTRGIYTIDPGNKIDFVIYIK